VAGTLAAPWFVGLWAAQAATRDGYDVTRHPISLLSLGDGGFVQIANFVVTGLLVVVLGRGRRTLYRDGTGGRAIPRLVQATGVGLIMAGAFVTDAGAGFPAGAPEGRPEYSAHGILHEVGSVVVMLSWTATMFLLHRRFRRSRERGWKRAILATFVGVVVLSLVPHVGSFPLRSVLAAGIQLACLAAVARHAIHR
jgi:hypothetical protein